MKVRAPRETAVLLGVVGLLLVGLINHIVMAPTAQSSPADAWQRLVPATSYILLGAILLFRAKRRPGIGWLSVCLLLLGLSEATLGAGNLLSLGFEVLGSVGIAMGLYAVIIWPPEIPEDKRLSAWFPVPIGALDIIARVARHFEYALMPWEGSSPESPVMAADALITIAVISTLSHNYWNTNELGRRRLRWVMLGWGLGLAPWLLWTLLSAWSPQLQGNQWWSTIAYACSALGPLGIVFSALIDDGFELDGEARVMMSLALGMMVSGWLVFGAYLGLSAGLSISPNAMRWLDLVTLVSLSGVWLLTYRLLHPRLLARFVPEKRAWEDARACARQALHTSTSTPEIAQVVCDALRTTLHPDTCSVYLLDLDVEAFLLAAGDGEGALIEEEIPAEVWDMTTPHALEVRSQGPAVLWAPVFVEDGVHALIVLGAKRSRGDYTAEERHLLVDLCERAQHAMERLSERAHLVHQRRRLEQLRHDASTLGERVEEEVARLRHDVKQPLATLRLLGELLEERAQDANTRTLAAQIHEISRSLHDLIDASISHHTGEVRLREVTLAGLEPELELLFGPRAMRQKLDLEFELGAHVVRANEAMLLRILSNLVGNALRYTEHGHVRVRAVQEDDQILIVVEDTGRGFDPGVADILAPGVRLTSQGDGHGLGLAIAHELASLMGASLKLESAPEQGTFATLAMPLMAKM